MKELKVKEPVRLRTKEIKGGNKSLYLDKYMDGRRVYEFLKLYLIPERTKADKERNAETMRLANAIKSQRTIEMQSERFGFQSATKQKINFLDYFVLLAKRHERNTASTWMNALAHIRAYDHRDNIRICDITPDWVRGFQTFLQTEAVSHYTNRPLATNTQRNYYKKLVCALNQAVADGILMRSPTMNIEGIKGKESTRQYLTIDEVRRLSQTECNNEVVKRAFLFSCLTGLRLSDVEKLTWADVHRQGSFDRIIFAQQKTGGQEYLDITPQASQLLGERMADDERVFAGLPGRTVIRRSIFKWVDGARINKHISFHCARHSFATMMLDIGTDLYTVSKLLGHREIQTTQIYAKVLDKNKQAAVAAIPPII